MCVSYTEPSSHPSASRLLVLIVLLASMLFCLFLHHRGISVAESLIYCKMAYSFFLFAKEQNPKQETNWLKKDFVSPIKEINKRVQRCPETTIPKFHPLYRQFSYSQHRCIILWKILAPALIKCEAKIMCRHQGYCGGAVLGLCKGCEFDVYTWQCLLGVRVNALTVFNSSRHMWPTLLQQ